MLVPSVGWPNPSMANHVDALIGSMSVEKKVGQLFIFGFTGKNFNQSLKRKLDRLYPGSIIIFGRNISSLNQIKSLNDRAQAVALKNTHIPLFIAVDQEGGKVLRIKTSPSLPSAKTLAMTEDPELVRSAGYVTGQLLHTLGFNMNLAPVVDISSPNHSDFLGNRAFGDKKEIVSKMSVAFARGLIDAGILPTAKHFPGHGGLTADSHLQTPYKKITLDNLLRTDLYPYAGILDQQVPFAIMASHVSYPLVDPSKLPATFSKILLQDVLRKQLKFPGIVMTDDIQMKGAHIENLSLEDRAVKAVLAGNDVIMVGWNYTNQRRAVRAVIKAVQDGRISQARLNQSLRRILKTKLRFFHKNDSENSLKSQLNGIAFTDIYNSIFDRVFTNQKTIEPQSGPVKVYSYSYRFLQTFRKMHSPQKGKYIPLSKHRSWKHAGSEPIIYHLSGPLSEKVLKAAPSAVKKNMVVVNSSSRNKVEDESQFRKVINVFSYHPSLGKFSAKYITKPRKPTIRRPSSYIKN